VLSEQPSADDAVAVLRARKKSPRSWPLGDVKAQASPSSRAPGGLIGSVDPAAAVGRLVTENVGAIEVGGALAAVAGDRGVAEQKAYVPEARSHVAATHAAAPPASWQVMPFVEQSVVSDQAPLSQTLTVLSTQRDAPLVHALCELSVRYPGWASCMRR